MPIKFRHSCGKKISCPDELAGKAVKCPRCGKRARVPKEIGDHTLKGDQPKAKKATKAAKTKKKAKKKKTSTQKWQLRHPGHASVLSLSWAKLQDGVADGSITAKDFVRFGASGEWSAVSDHPELGPKAKPEPSRVGGLSFSDSGEREPADQLGGAQCWRHPSRAAEFYCSECERAMCPECMNKIRGEILCQECTDKLIEELEHQAGQEAVLDEKALLPTPPEGVEAVPANLALTPQQASATNRAVITELLLAFCLGWLGIGWLYTGRAIAGLLLLTGNFALLIAEVSAYFLGPVSFRPDSFGRAVLFAVPVVLVQNALVGTISAVTLRAACIQAARRAQAEQEE